MALYLMLGGSGTPGTNGTYDQDWWRGSAHIDVDYVDVDSFEDTADALGGERRDQWAVFDPFTIGDFLEPEVMLAPALLGPVAGKITLQILRPPLEVEGITPDATLSVAIQHPDTTGRTWESGEAFITNAIELEGAIDAATGEVGHRVVAYQGTSLATYGLRNMQTVRVGGLTGIEALIAIGKDLADRFFGVYAFPRSLMGIPYARIEAWDVKVGDVILLSDDLLPAMSVGGAAATVGRGFDGVLARCLGKVDTIPAIRESGATRSAIQMVSYKRDGSRRSQWAPSATCSSLAGSGFQLVCYDHRHTSTGSSLIDVQYFDTTRAGAGARIQIHEAGDYSTLISRTINNVTIAGADASYIQVASSVSLTPPLIIEFDDYDTAITTTQKKYAYMTDGVTLLDSTDTPYRYV
jgi:hypothetical protein